MSYMKKILPIFKGTKGIRGDSKDLPSVCGFEKFVLATPRQVILFTCLLFSSIAVEL